MALMRGATPWLLVGRDAERGAVLGALSDPSQKGVLICGPAGVGKTRLAQECVTTLGQRGRAIGRATATDAAAAVPLAALAPVLAFDEAVEQRDPAAVFDRAALSLRRRATGGPFALLVDDADLLDTTSAVLLGQLLDAGALTVVATARTGGRRRPEAMAWWRGEQMSRVDVADLDQQEVDALLRAALGGPVTAATSARVWQASRGNPLLVRELVLGAQSAGDLVEDAGVWRLRGPLRRTDRLVELIASRLRATDASALPVLEHLALFEPVGLEELEAVAPPETVERLERDGLIEIRTERRRDEVTLTHPLHADVLRDGMPRSTRRRLLREQATRVERHGARRRRDPLRIATWRLEAVGSVDPDLLRTAVRLAREDRDLRQLGRLARAALQELPEGRDRVEPQLVLGEVLADLGEFDEAETVLTEAFDVVSDPGQLARIADVRAHALLRGLRQTEKALAMIRAARERAGDDTAQSELVALEATVLTFSGRPVQALQVLDGAGPALERRARVLRAGAEAAALALTGRGATARRAAREGLAEHVVLGNELVIVQRDTHMLNESFALQQTGALDEAVALAAAGFDEASSDRSPIARAWFAVHVGRASLMAGRPLTARTWLAEGRALAREYGWLGPHRLAVSGLAIAGAWLGDTAAANVAVAEMDDLPDFDFLATEPHLGRAWAAVAEGDPHGARERLHAAATHAADVGHLASEAWLLHDVARLGDPNSVRERLTTLADRCEGELVAVYAQHARAAASDDPEALATAADGFERLGADLLAAEAAAEAAIAARRAGRPRRAAAWENRSAALVTRCEGARTPALMSTTVAAQLTRREREIAVLAAEGTPSRRIATLLHLSVRTVDSHLHKAYVKLGVTSREQLLLALNPATGAAESDR